MMTSTLSDPIPAVLRDYDLAPVTRRLQAQGVANATSLETEFRKLATLWALYPGQKLAPSKHVDDYWHEAILDTRRYRDFCDRILKRFIDHVSSSDRSAMQERYTVTMKLYERHFGPPDSSMWGTVGANSMND